MASLLPSVLRLARGTTSNADCRPLPAWQLVSFELQDAAWLVEISSTQKLVLLCLAAHADEHGLCWPSVKRIAARCRLTPRAVMLSLQHLEKAGHVTRQMSPGRVTRYRVHPCTTFTGESSSPVHHVHRTSERRSPDPCTTFTGPVNDVHPESPRTPNEPVKNPQRRKSKASGTPEFHRVVIDLYHECLPSAPRVMAWTPNRQQALDARIRERIAEGKLADQPVYWRGFFETVAASDFLAGRATDFCADLEWLLGPKNFLKVIEGRYTNRTAKDSRHADA